MAEPQDSATSTTRISTPVLATIIAVGAIIAAGAAFFVTSKVINKEPSAAERCAAAKAEILEVKAAFPDSSKLGAGEDARLNAAATDLRSTCSYTETVDFESIEVFPWLGIDTSAPASSTPADDAAADAPTDTQQAPPTSTTTP